jgi:hypothetical protein
MDRRKNIAGKIVLKEIEEIKKQLYNLESRIIKNYPKSLDPVRNIVKKDLTSLTLFSIFKYN